jgi:HTH-type transcriptional regulator, competence development regulator
MSDGNNQSARTTTFGDYLKATRLGLRMTLRDVEGATNKEISNAYLSQLETGKVENPSPHVLYSLAQVYGVSYESLMERAGYIMPSNAKRTSATKHGHVATHAIENLDADEERELLKYLAFFRSTRSRR